MDIKDIQHLIKFVAKSGAHEVKLEMEDIKITIKTGPDQTFNENSGMVQQVQPMPVLAQAPVPPVASAPEIVAAPVQSEEDNLITIKSPIIGTFYRKATPDKPSFVEIGQAIKEGDVLCVIEAMKLFNEIESELSGTIVKILVDDASPVEFDQPLFVINPS
jgi:acetyl-CoA carboxylase biotin carboxyl carrier protein